MVGEHSTETCRFGYKPHVPTHPGVNDQLRQYAQLASSMSAAQGYRASVWILPPQNPCAFSMLGAVLALRVQRMTLSEGQHTLILMQCP